eukprot:TRINITY_DN8893_c0_g1_i1.p1 TRINITY_DN8893_c0_g1~~TRINITY_DN8893_c0_g1_i1.p1  ORF type:complete len:377 (+),score=55.45 TRINITY_DN8893_c0_g1_i1:248-1378(+)
MGQYGVGVAAVSMLSTLGVTMSTAAFGPITDNAGGLAEMVEELPEGVRQSTEALDALGNTTGAMGKAYAMGAAVLTSLSLLSAFQDRVVSNAGTLSTSLDDPIVLGGLLFGSMMPFLFAALTTISVGVAAQEIVKTVRQQFDHKAAEERAAILATANTPYRPWDFLSREHESQLDPALKAMSPLEYYRHTLEGQPLPEGRLRDSFLLGAMHRFGMAIPTNGFPEVSLNGVAKAEAGAVKIPSVIRDQGLEVTIPTSLRTATVDESRYMDCARQPGPSRGVMVSGNCVLHRSTARPRAPGPSGSPSLRHGPGVLFEGGPLMSQTASPSRPRPPSRRCCCRESTPSWSPCSSGSSSERGASQGCWRARSELAPCSPSR